MEQTCASVKRQRRCEPRPTGATRSTTAVPPSTGPATGDTERSFGWPYCSKSAPSAENCWPFITTSKGSGVAVMGAYAPDASHAREAARALATADSSAASAAS